MKINITANTSAHISLVWKVTSVTELLESVKGLKKPKHNKMNFIQLKNLQIDFWVVYSETSAMQVSSSIHVSAHQKKWERAIQTLI